MDIEELEDLLGPDDVDVDFRRTLEEARETKKGAQYFKRSAQMVRVNSLVSRSRWPSTKGRGTRLGGDQLLQVVDGGKRAWNNGEFDGARCRVMEAAEGLGDLRQHESGH